MSAERDKKLHDKNLIFISRRPSSPNSQVRYDSVVSYREEDSSERTLRSMRSDVWDSLPDAPVREQELNHQQLKNELARTRSREREQIMVIAKLEEKLKIYEAQTQEFIELARRMGA